MSFQDLLRDTLATLWAHKRRTMLTMFGIAWGIISITVMVEAGGTRSGRLIRWSEEDYVQVAKEAPACKYVMPELGNNVQVHSLFNSGDLKVVGALPPFTEIRSITVAQGRFYNEEDNAEARNVAFLGSDAKKQLFAEREALGQTIWMNGIPYTVIGVMKHKEQNSSYDGADVRKIFIPFNAMRRDFPNKPPAIEHSVNRLLVAPWSLETHPDCVKQIRRTLGRLHNFDPRDKEAAGIWDTVKNAQANRMIIVGMEVFMVAVGVATLFLGGLGVMNVMLVSVRERRYGTAALLRFLCPGQSASDAAVFCGFADKLEARRAIHFSARLDRRPLGPLSCESRCFRRSYRSPPFRGGRLDAN